MSPSRIHQAASKEIKLASHHIKPGIPDAYALCVNVALPGEIAAHAA